MQADIATLVPRFYWGFIAPRRPTYARGPGYQFYRIVPLDVVQVEVGLGIREYTSDAVETALENLWECVDLLVDERADRITLGGAPISAALGRARVLEVLGAITARTGVDADAPVEAVIAALHHLGCTSVAIGSRWADEVNDRLVAYLEDGEIRVAGVTSRGQWAEAAHRMSLEEGLAMALAVGREAAESFQDADAIFVPGGAAMALHVIPRLEAEFRKPVLTNLSAEVWRGLVSPGVIDPVEDWGTLLSAR